MSGGRIIAVDFDGTLCYEAWPGIGEPREGVLEYVRDQKAQGARLVLWTCRRGERLEDALKWCGERRIVFDAVNENLPDIVAVFGGDCRKIYADEYLEDKAVIPEEAERRMGMSGRRRRTYYGL